jgi:ParB family transcriptional regulator, chromosome partitioning protein
MIKVLELHQVEARYRSLRIVDKQRQARLLVSLSEHGQQSPALVVEEQERFVLIDGYRRLAALEQLGRDTLSVLVLSMGEPDALVLWHSLQKPGRGHVLEEAWLLRELHETHGLAQSTLARRLERSVSWVSRRLALTRDLVPALEELVREGAVSAQAAMKSLVPLARAKPEQAAELVRALKGQRLSTRQAAKLYAAWRRGNPQQRLALVRDPLLHLAALEELERGALPEPRGVLEAGPIGALQRELERLAQACWRARRVLADSVLGMDSAAVCSVVGTWQVAQRAFHALSKTFEQETAHVGP